ncbi:MAG: NAD(P)H-dependent glycerol-3-phosphate dehydrogenase [Leptothrix ochracea]|uniref:NAD(P)H-dependent glycerol-3-phosphate dehydrogenase n=1 Tax=Leptothrix ochracea TaxID=735331 RepID=UPI0034E25C48
MHISVLGAGAWGTAIAAQAALHHPTFLWARDPIQADAMDRQRVNTRYLPDVHLPPGLQVNEDFSAALWHAATASSPGEGTRHPSKTHSSDHPSGLIVLATPMAGLRDMLERLSQAPVAEHCAVLWLSKGFEARTGRLGHEIAQQVAPTLRVGVLSGPSFAVEVARGQPTALVAASSDALVRQLAVRAFHSPQLRIYSSTDPIGVEVGGAVKNIMAIATGVIDGMGLGLNARAALITRGLAEITRLGVALGAQADTFMGLSGLGDLVLTATGDLSRNRQVGLKLAQGRTLAQILDELGHVAEGVYSARTVLQRARTLGVDMPITRAVVALIESQWTPDQAVHALMSRESRSEH